MGVIETKESSSGGEGDGWGGSNPSGGTSNAPDGVPAPGSDKIPGVVIGRKGGEIIIVFPDTDIAGPGLVASTNISTSGNSPADALMAGGFVASYGASQPSVVIDMGSVTTTETASDIEPVEVDSSDAIINLIDDDSARLSLADVEISNRPCPLPVFNLSFESDLDLSGPYYNQAASADAIAGGNAAADPGADDDTATNTEKARERVEWAKTVADIIDKIIDVDKNIKTEAVLDFVVSKWDVTNKNVLNDLMTDLLDNQREIDYGYYVTESNYKDIAQTTPGGADAEEFIRLYDTALYVANGLSSSVYAYNSHVGKEEDVISLEMVDIPNQGYPSYESYNYQSFYLGV